MTVNDFGPAVDAKNPTLLRNALIKRTIYAIGYDESPADLVANTSGQVPLGLAYDGRVFWLDPDDTTSVHDGTTVIVTSDGYRYHADDFRMPWSVLAINEPEPPTSSSIGDAYLTSAAPTGDWAGHPEQVAVYTRRGWVFVEMQVGQMIYVEDDSGHWVYLDENGDILNRFGNSPESVEDGALVGGQRRYIVQSQTVNTPPGSPALGVYWIIGSAPTGAWAGNAGNIATSYNGSAWTIIAAVDGLEAFDRALGANFIYRTGIGWTSAAGAWGGLSIVRTPGTGSTTSVGSTNYGLDTDTTPTTTHGGRRDDASLTYTARSGAILRFTYKAKVSALSNQQIVGLFRDAESNAMDWSGIMTFGASTAPDNKAELLVQFVIPALDGNSHTYHIRIFAPTAANRPTQFANRALILEEAA